MTCYEAGDLVYPSPSPAAGRHGHNQPSQCRGSRVRQLVPRGVTQTEPKSKRNSRCRPCRHVETRDAIGTLQAPVRRHPAPSQLEFVNVTAVAAAHLSLASSGLDLPVRKSPGFGAWRGCRFQQAVVLQGPLASQPPAFGSVVLLCLVSVGKHGAGCFASRGSFASAAMPAHKPAHKAGSAWRLSMNFLGVIT